MTTLVPTCWGHSGSDSGGSGGSGSGGGGSWKDEIKSAFMWRSKLGRMIEGKVWRNADKDIRDEADYQGRGGGQAKEKGFDKLETNTMSVSLTSIIPKSTRFSIPMTFPIATFSISSHISLM